MLENSHFAITLLCLEQDVKKFGEIDFLFLKTKSWFLSVEIKMMDSTSVDEVLHVSTEPNLDGGFSGGGSPAILTGNQENIRISLKGDNIELDEKWVLGVYKKITLEMTPDEESSGKFKLDVTVDDLLVHTERGLSSQIYENIYIYAAGASPTFPNAKVKNFLYYNIPDGKSIICTEYY